MIFSIRRKSVNCDNCKTHFYVLVMYLIRVANLVKMKYCKIAEMWLKS